MNTAIGNAILNKYARALWKTAELMEAEERIKKSLPCGHTKPNRSCKYCLEYLEKAEDYGEDYDVDNSPKEWADLIDKVDRLDVLRGYNFNAEEANR